MSSRTNWDVDAVAQIAFSLGTTHAAGGSTKLGVAVNLASTLFDTSARYLASVFVCTTSTGSSTRAYTFTVRAATASGGTYSTANLENSGGSLALVPSSSPSTGGTAGETGLISFLPKATHPFIKVACVGAGAGTARTVGSVIGIPASL